MTQKATHILWLDLETSGTGDDASILEVAVVLTEATPALRPVAAWTSPIAQPPMYKAEMEGGAYTMHDANGLLQDIDEGRGILLTEADEAIRNLIDKHVAKTRRVPLGGSGVGHYDRKFVNRDLPKVAKRLTYWPIDVGVVRRMCQMAGVELPPAPEKSHRAFECVTHAIDEGYRYFDLLSRAA